MQPDEVRGDPNPHREGGWRVGGLEGWSVGVLEGGKVEMRMEKTTKVEWE